MLLQLATLAWAAVQPAVHEQPYGCELAARASIEAPAATPEPEGPSDGGGSDCPLSPSELAGGDVLIDQRPRAQYEAWPIPGAVHGVPSDVGTMRMFAPKRVVLIGTGRDDATLLRRCRQLRENGAEHVFVLVGGIRTLVEASELDVPPNLRDRLYLLSSHELHRLAQDEASVLAAGLDDAEVQVWNELLKLPIQPADPAFELNRSKSADTAPTRIVLLSDGRAPTEWMEKRHLQPDARLFFYNQRPDVFRRDLAMAETIASNAYKPLPSGACGR